MNVRQSIAFSIVFIILFYTYGWGITPPASRPDTTNSEKGSIIFISDTQAPMWFEKLFVKTHRNEEATKTLFKAIADDSSVSNIFFLGDLTAMSSFDNNWATIDTFLACLRTRYINTYAAAGNHDYLLAPESGEANLKKRFPSYQRLGYLIRIDSLAFILLNSNFAELTRSEEAQQQKWYINKLHDLDMDTTIKLITVGCHHPPFSNSSIVGHSQKVRDTFVPPFMKSIKGRLFLSGHAHTFQHFKDTLTDKHFLVIGGGGGLLHTLDAPEPGELQDQVQWNADYRMFHYVRGTITPDGLLLSVFMLNEELEGPISVYEVKIPYQKR